MLGTSIILATYCPDPDRLDLIKRSFSEIHRTGVDRDRYELIVVNNGGIHDHLVRSLDVDLLITLDRNIGQGMALNVGASVAKGLNLFFTDDDISYTDGYLRAGLKLLNRHKECVISLREYGQQFAEPYKGNYISDRAGGIWLMRRSLYLKIGRFSDLFAFGGLWTRNLRRRGHWFIISKTPYVRHLGWGHSIIGMDREKIRRYRKRE